LRALVELRLAFGGSLRGPHPERIEDGEGTLSRHPAGLPAVQKGVKADDQHQQQTDPGKPAHIYLDKKKLGYFSMILVALYWPSTL
jgi:hypothetical protein